MACDVSPVAMFPLIDHLEEPVGATFKAVLIAVDMPKTLPPFVSNFGKKINPHFFFSEIESMIANTNFTLGPIENSFFLLQLKRFTFSIN